MKNVMQLRVHKTKPLWSKSKMRQFQRNNKQMKQTQRKKKLRIWSSRKIFTRRRNKMFIHSMGTYGKRL